MIRVNEADVAPAVSDAAMRSSLYEIVGHSAAIDYDHFSIAKTVLARGGAVERHYHRLSDEIYLFVKGIGQMRVNQETFPVGPGDLVLIEPNDWHDVTAVGEEGLEFYTITRPAYSADDFLTEEDTTL